MLRLPVASGEALGIVPDGPLDRDPVPGDDLDPAHERRMAEPGCDVGDEILALPALDVVFHHERQEGQHGTERKRKQIIGVQVVQGGEDLGHFAVEGDLRGQGQRIGRMLQFLQEQLETLDRVDRMHRPLQGQVDIVLLEQDQRLADQQLAVLERQFAHRHQEGCQVHCAGKVLSDCGVHFFQVGRRFRRREFCLPAPSGRGFFLGSGHQLFLLVRRTCTINPCGSGQVIHRGLEAPQSPSIRRERESLLHSEG